MKNQGAKQFSDLPSCDVTGVFTAVPVITAIIEIRTAGGKLKPTECS